MWRRRLAALLSWASLALTLIALGQLAAATLLDGPPSNGFRDLALIVGAMLVTGLAGALGGLALLLLLDAHQARWPTWRLLAIAAIAAIAILPLGTLAATAISGRNLGLALTTGILILLALLGLAQVPRHLRLRR